MRLVMIRKEVLLVLPLLIIGIVFVFMEKNDSVPTMYLPITDKIIAIDAGHGGIDPGAVGKQGVEEDEINLQIALKLRKLIEENGGIAILTRNDGEGLYTGESKTVRDKKNEDLRNRKIEVNNSEPDVLLSIHLNSFPKSQYYGAQTFYKAGCEKSKNLAYLIQEELKNVLDKNNKRIPQSRDNIYLIREAEVPAVLVECGFLSNLQEESKLKDPKYQQKIAWGIYIGVMRYFNEYEK
ncbi:N-acetylmuramoyl-L-alanine amidase CwlD [Proteiniborus sp. MB09-C3]|uniref:N-acetylmuramoyl-L-alanine amidase CwlD n=1 Tax=Proteiniborus sp. MB09-C3 TaxID=3050072 RepID=UPI002552EB59|nr:N-acetylmuramoyl-L-alanine amidase CwlD [Proteiniborus sp. MB09-C3]WIV13252.1 N-acetylmuramoyl-L-alanine amidase CwlD [Proteiniborus sp. MB09-C3]